MKQFRIKQYSHNNLYCIQQRTGLFSWKTLETKTIRQHAIVLGLGYIGNSISKNK